MNMNIIKKKALCPALLLTLVLSGAISANTVSANRAAWKRINQMKLTKVVATRKNPAAMAAERVIFYFDSNNRIRKIHHSNPGADGAGETTQYFRADGSVLMVQWFEGVNEQYRFQGVMHLNRAGYTIYKGSKLYDSWMSNPAKRLVNVPLKRYGTNGHGNYIAWYANTRELSNAFKYPANFSNKGTVRFTWKKNTWLRTAGHGATVRATPSLKGRVLARLPAAASLKITGRGRLLRLSGWGRMPWYKVSGWHNGKQFAGWMFGGLIEPAQQQ